MKNSSLSPSRDVYHSPKTVTRFPPSDRVWEETLRGDVAPHSKKSPALKAPPHETDLNELITESLAHLRGSRQSLPEQVAHSQSPSKAALRDPGTVDMLLKAAEEVKQKWSQRQSLNGQQGPLTPNSRKLLVQRMIERNRKKLQSEGQPGQRVDTEPAKAQEWEDEEQPYSSPSPARVVHTEESPRGETDPSSVAAVSPVKKLKAELKSYREKYRKIEAMYATLLTHREHENPQNKYKRLYESLRQKYSHDQKQWETQTQALRLQLEQKTQESQHFAAKASQQSADLGVFTRLQRDIEEMKVRVTRTERDNETLREELAKQRLSLQAK